MTDQEIAGLGPAFAGYLKQYRDCFLQERTATHFGNYCRGLLSDLPRKSVERDRAGLRNGGPHPPGVPGHRRLAARGGARDVPAAHRRGARRVAR